jgi:dTDP-4-amino-4,6-dideoxygalactose transaminase
MEGGALCSADEEIIERAKRIRDFGQDEDRECIDIGLNGKMMEVCALVGLENLKDWREYRHHRTLKCATFRHRLSGIEGLRVIHEPEGQWPIWTYLPVFVEPEFGKTRDEVLAFLHSKNIGARKYYTACHLLKPFASGQSLPVTERIASQVIALPLYGDMSDDEMSRVVDAFKETKP